MSFATSLGGSFAAGDGVCASPTDDSNAAANNAIARRIYIGRIPVKDYRNPCHRCTTDASHGENIGIFLIRYSVAVKARVINGLALAKRAAGITATEHRMKLYGNIIRICEANAAWRSGGSAHEIHFGRFCRRRPHAGERLPA